MFHQKAYLLVLKLPNNFSAWNKKCKESHQRVGHGVEGGGQVVDGVAVRQAGVSLNEKLKKKFTKIFIDCENLNVITGYVIKDSHPPKKYMWKCLYLLIVIRLVSLK
jgi:hypothetical protein